MMSKMGIFRTTVLIENPARRGYTLEVPGTLVDTGSEHTWIPRVILESLAIRVERRLRFRLADGRIVEREVGFAIVHAAGTATADDIVFAEEGDMILIGARSLEGLNLRVDPAAKVLVPAGPITAAVA
jgi:predicted aspartyl protease